MQPKNSPVPSYREQRLRTPTSRKNHCQDTLKGLQELELIARGRLDSLTERAHTDIGEDSQVAQENKIPRLPLESISVNLASPDSPLLHCEYSGLVEQQPKIVLKRPKAKGSRLASTRSSSSLTSRSQIEAPGASLFRTTNTKIAPTKKTNRSQLVANKNLLRRYQGELRRLQSDICKVSQPSQAQLMAALFSQIEGLLQGQLQA